MSAGKDIAAPADDASGTDADVDDGRRDDIIDLEDRSDVHDLEQLEFDPQLEADPDGPAPRTIVFDIGEVLLDESRVWAVWADLLGVSPLTFAAVLGAAIVQGEDHETAFPHVAPNVDWRDFEEEHERRYGGFQATDLYPDARPCLTELHTLGFSIAIAGNQPRRRRGQLERLQLPYDHLVTSDELGVEKPDPEFFARLVRAIDGDDVQQILYVGDRVDNDIAPAAAFGMRTCWLRRGPWGHLQDPPPGLEPDLVLEGLGELPLLLSHWRDTSAGG